MMWLLVLFAFLIFGPIVLFLVGMSFLVVALPFVIFVGIWAMISWLFISLFVGHMLLGLLLGFVAGLWAMRQLQARRAM